MSQAVQNLIQRPNQQDQIMSNFIYFNFSFFVPSVGVTISEGTKQKTGGKNFYSIFSKPSVYDYRQLVVNKLLKIRETLLKLTTELLSYMEQSFKRTKLLIKWP